MKLLLFDVDLTLINSGGAGRRAMTRAFEELFHKKNGFARVHLAGRTDTLILKDALQRCDLPWNPTVEQNFRQLYFKYLKEEMQVPNPDKKLMPGIPELLKIIRARKDLELGLLTGNWREGAMIKLGYFDLVQYFSVGAFGDDSEHRNELPEIVVRRFTQKYRQSIKAEDVYIIGDTPLDIDCARSFGARSVAVATGLYSFEQLQKAQPDLIFNNLSDPQKFLSLITTKIL